MTEYETTVTSGQDDNIPVRKHDVSHQHTIHLRWIC